MGIDETIKPILTGSVVNDKIYIFNQLHFHWGTQSKFGSEHSIDSVFYPLEVIKPQLTGQIVNRDLIFIQIKLSQSNLVSPSIEQFC